MGKIIPFFDKYPIVGVKSKSYEDFKQVALIVKDKKHLTPPREAQDCLPPFGGGGAKRRSVATEYALKKIYLFFL